MATSILLLPEGMGDGHLLSSFRQRMIATSILLLLFLKGYEGMTTSLRHLHSSYILPSGVEGETISIPFSKKEREREIVMFTSTILIFSLKRRVDDHLRSSYSSLRAGGCPPPFFLLKG